MKSKLDALVALIVAGCGDGSGAVDTSPSPDLGDSDSNPIDIASDLDVEAATEPETHEAPEVVGPVDDCDPLDPAACALPFPSSLYLVPDARTRTGWRLEFGNSLPRNVDGKPIDGSPYRRLDGYGVGTPLLTVLPNIDLTGMASEWNITPSLAENAKIVWLELAPGAAKPERVPYWVDVDVVEPDASRRVTIVRPARLLREGARQFVAFRHITTTDGAPMPVAPAFRALRDGTTAGDPSLAPRQARFDEVFQVLADHGVKKDELTLAWDFQTASNDALHGTMLQMRDHALTTVGPDGPLLKDLVVEDTPSEEGWALEVRMKLVVPHYMWPAPTFRIEGNVWNLKLDERGNALQNGEAEADVWMRIPKSAVDGSGTPHRLVLYGHGQTGSGAQVRGGHNARIANTYHYIFVATKMWGMSEDDSQGILDTLFDLSGFLRISDRCHQGVLNHILLARAMKRRFATLPELTSRGIVVDASEIYYSGISQGGIFGPTFLALSPDLVRGHFGVPGNNYAFLIERSHNFAPFFLVISATYPERVDQVIAMHTVEQLWEQTDSVSYIRHLTADPFPLPDGAAGVIKRGLWAPAKGDIQVPVTSNEWLARSDIGVPIMRPWNPPSRPEVSEAEMADYPRLGSGIVLYDFGNPWPDESVNAAPTSDAEDPHGKPKNDLAHARQLDHFFRTGEIIDVCSDDGAAGCAPN